jgi:hypothetical protein
MRPTPSHDLYSPREIALAAGVPEADVIAAIGGDVRRLVVHADAVRLGRALVARASSAAPTAAEADATRPPATLFSMFSGASPSRRPAGVPLAVSSTLHVGLIAAAVFIATFNLSPRAAALRTDDPPADPMRLVFVATPGPGGGGGGGGLLQKAPPPKARRPACHQQPAARAARAQAAGACPGSARTETGTGAESRAIADGDRADHHGSRRFAKPRRRVAADSGRD